MSDDTCDYVNTNCRGPVRRWHYTSPAGAEFDHEYNACDFHGPVGNLAQPIEETNEETSTN